MKVSREVVNQCRRCPRGQRQRRLQRWRRCHRWQWISHDDDDDTTALPNMARCAWQRRSRRRRLPQVASDGDAAMTALMVLCQIWQQMCSGCGDDGAANYGKAEAMPQMASGGNCQHGNSDGDVDVRRCYRWHGDMPLMVSGGAWHGDDATGNKWTMPDMADDATNHGKAEVMRKR